MQRLGDHSCCVADVAADFWRIFLANILGGFFGQKGRKGAGVKGAGVANCRIFRSAVPSVVVWSILLVSLSGVKKKL